MAKQIGSCSLVSAWIVLIWSSLNFWLTRNVVSIIPVTAVTAPPYIIVENGHTRFRKFNILSEECQPFLRNLFTFFCYAKKARVFRVFKGNFFAPNKGQKAFFLKKEKTFQKAIDKRSHIEYNINVATREWRNWQTRTFEGRVVYTVRVQVPFLAPTNKKDIRKGVLFALGGRKRDEVEGKPFNSSGEKRVAFFLSPDISRTNKQKGHPQGGLLIRKFTPIL